MSNVIKYTTTPVNDTIKKGNFALGVNDVDYGPTNITGFYATTIPSTSGYTIYNENGGTLSYQSVSGTTPLISYLSNKRGVNMTTDGEALSWAAGQSNIFVTNREYENIVTSGMVLNLDAGFVSSYPTSAATWYDLSYSGNNGTLVNSPTFSSLSGGSIVFDGTDDYTNFVTTLPSSTTYTVSSWFYTDTGNWNGALFGFGTGDSPNTQDVYLFGEEPSGCPSPNGGSFGFNTWNCDSFGIGNASTLLKGTGFHHVTATFNHQNVGNNQLWVDGILQPMRQQIGSTNFSANLNNQFKIAANGWFTSGQLWKGKVSNLQAYRRILSPFEVYQNYNAMKGRFGIPDIVTSGLTLNVDAGNPYSYNPLNTGSTTWTDVSGSNNNGTLTNGTNYSGGTMVFDGTNDYTAIPNFMGNTNTFTVSHFIYLSGIQNTRTIFSNYGAGNNGWVTGIRDDQNNVFKFYLGNTVHLYSNTVLSSFTWYHVAVTYNNGSPRIYINGTLNNSSSNTITFASSYFGNDIGRLGIGSQYFNGKIGNVQVYNRALSPTEIYQNFNALKNRYGFYDIVQEGLVLNLDAGNPNSYNPLNTGSTTWNDVSGYGNNGTLINGTYYSGGTMVFDGTDDYVESANNLGLSGTNPRTYGVWVKIRTYLDNSGIIRTGAQGTANADMSLETTTTPGTFTFNGWVNDFDFTISSNFYGWHYLVITYTGTQGQGYADGVLKNSLTFTSVAPNSKLQLGSDRQAGAVQGNNLDGSIGEVHVYNRLLTASEILQNFNATRYKYGV